MEAETNVQVRDLNENFICIICNGYLIRPVAITECLHYFCRSCIVKYLDSVTDYKCPVCDTLIHETNPWDMLREDKTLEYIVLKLVPGLADREKLRRKFFYEEQGLSDPVDMEGDSHLTLCAPDSEPSKRDDKAENSSEDKVKVSLSSLGNSQIGFHLRLLSPASRDKESRFGELDKPFIRSSAHLTIAHVKKFLQLQLRYPDTCDVDILCNGELMGRHHTLEFIYMTRWRYKEGILILDYRPKVELSC